MTQKWKARLAMAGFLAVCLLPSAGMFLLPPAAPAAHQILSPRPRFRLEDGRWNWQVLREAADYAADHIAFRQEGITARALLNAWLFHTSCEDAVVMGEGDWLFYRETLSDVYQTEPMTRRQLYGAARALALLREYAAARGAALYFTVAPNKASLYPSRLPDFGPVPEGESNLERLLPLLQAEGVPYVDLFAPFREQEDILYYHTDSHWNTRGAALAHDALMEAIREEGDWQPFFSGPYHPGEGRRGDLYEMLYPAGTYREPDAAFDRPFAFSYTKSYRGPDDQRIETAAPRRGGSLLMFRDSFGNSLHPFLADSFGAAVFSRARPYPMSLLDGADTVLIEIVERNLKELAREAPIFPAPERVLPETPRRNEEIRAALWIARGGELPGFFRLEGLLCQAAASEGSTDSALQPDADSPIYLRLGKTVYEATPVGKDWEAGIPFALYLPAGETGAEAEILYTCGGTLYCGGAVAIQSQEETE